MGPRQHQHELVPDQVVPGQDRPAQLDLLGQAAGPVVHDGHVDVTGTDLAQALAGQRLPQHQGQPRVGAQAAGERGRERDGRGREGGRHHPSGRLGGLGGQVGLGLLDHGQDALGVAGQAPARVGQLGPARRPVEQRGARLALERGQLLGDRGRGVAEDGGGPGDAAARGEFLEQTEPVQIEHKRTLLSAIEISACTYGLGAGKLSRCAGLPHRSFPQPCPPIPAARKCQPPWLSPSRPRQRPSPSPPRSRLSRPASRSPPRSPPTRPWTHGAAAASRCCRWPSARRACPRTGRCAPRWPAPPGATPTARSPGTPRCARRRPATGPGAACPPTRTRWSAGRAARPCCSA